ncbi:MAG: signal peptidase I [Anaerosomatales bacterium]|nr:signal peptidase I [Anaerosomatales bacterium]
MGPEWRFIPFRDSDRRHLPLLAILTALLVVVVLVFVVIYRPAVVSGDSMYPTLHDADRVLFTRDYTEPRRGDIVLAAALRNGMPVRIIKRVVAVSGDTVEVQGDCILVNGEPEPHRDLTRRACEYPRIGPLVVPEGRVFLAGDNRPASIDSRLIGTVDVGDIAGRAAAIFAPVHRVRLIDAGDPTP